MKARGFEDLTFLNLKLTLCGMKKRRCLWLFFCLIRIASKTYIISLQFLQVSLSNFFSEGDSWGRFSIMRVLLFTSSSPQDILVRFLYCLQRVRLFVSSKMNSFFLGQRRLKRFICKQTSNLDHPLALGETFGKNVRSDLHLRYPLHDDAYPVLTSLYL